MDKIELTNEEAIIQLNGMKLFIGYDKENELVRIMQEALDMGIKALREQDKSKKLSDFIKSNAKDNDFWKEIKLTVSTDISKEELEKLFENDS